MKVSIENLYVVVYVNPFDGKLNAHASLFDDYEKAKELAKELPNGEVRTVFYDNK